MLNSEDQAVLNAIHKRFSKIRRLGFPDERNAWAEARLYVEMVNSTYDRARNRSNVEAEINPGQPEIGRELAAPNDPLTPVQSCWDSSQCAANEICYQGGCIARPALEDNSRVQGPGDCDLPDPNPGLCGPQGCTEPSCGEPVGTDDCGNPGRQPCAKFVDEYYKANGVAPEGWSSDLACTECFACNDAQECQPRDPEEDDDIPCYCDESLCADGFGPCFDCDKETGECEKTCQNCITECNQFFKCPCDPRQQSFEVWGSYSPCQDGLEFGPGGTCWQSVAARVEAFCTASYPCEVADNPCLSNCYTVSSPGTSYPCETAPEGTVCLQRGFITNDETNQSTALAEICDQNPNCIKGCNGDPSDPLTTLCGSCETCSAEGLCVRKPDCGIMLNEGSGNYTPVLKTRRTSQFGCRSCSGVPLTDGNLVYCDMSPEYGPDYFSTNVSESESTFSTYYSDGFFSFSYGFNESFSYSCGGGGGATPDCSSQEIVAGQVSYQRYYNLTNGEFVLAIFTSELTGVETTGCTVGGGGAPANFTTSREVARVNFTPETKPYPTISKEQLTSMAGYTGHAVIATAGDN